jgi:flagellar hook protein FlgE
MGIFGALNTAVTGLRAQAYALENISGNIANSQTVGFKRIDTMFQDLIPDGNASMQLAGSVLAGSRNTNSVQGDLQNASIGTFMAINGDGFFLVQKANGYVGGDPTFDGVDLFTRRGDFVPDRNGYLVNGAGYYLMGVPIDPVTGNPVGNVPQVLQFQNDFIPASRTTEVQYRANLASMPRTQAYDPSIPGSELLDPTGFTVNPLIGGTGTVVGDDVEAFMKQSISGGGVTVFDALGNPVNLQMRWAKVESAAGGGTDRWELFYQEDGNATGTDVAWRNAGVSYTFGADGQMAPPVNNVALTGVVINGVTVGDVNIAHGPGGISQFADPNGRIQVNTFTQNGYAAGELAGISINDQGRLTGAYTNGRIIDIAEITLANFNGPDMLKRLDGGAFAATAESGAAFYGAPGQIVSSALEASNTDIADEFTKLIVTQQAYSANTRIVTSANEMVRDLLNMLR